ncbi:hypothetical protein B0H10DRAFT_2244438 [Mycena sp. CBHHK59/15]|nr:hypothetical protein B0H10DRAFT_2244438 [Mycena sp. CBHHK59/15]
MLNQAVLVLVLRRMVLNPAPTCTSHLTPPTLTSPGRCLHPRHPAHLSSTPPAPTHPKRGHTSHCHLPDRALPTSPSGPPKMPALFGHARLYIPPHATSPDSPALPPSGSLPHTPCLRPAANARAPARC